MAKFATLVDDFTTGSLSAPWATDGIGILSVSPSVVMNIELSQTNLKTVGPWDLTSSSVFAQMAMPATSAGNMQHSMRISTGTSTNTANEVRWFRSGVANIDARYTIGGVGTTLVTLTYDPIAHAWLRIRHSGGTVFWDTSPDGTTWTNRASTAAISWDLTDCYLRFTASRFNPDAGTVTVDNVNIVPPPPVIPPGIQAKVEVEFVPGSGVWRDLSNRVTDVQISRPRIPLPGGGATTTLTVALLNDPITSAEVGLNGVTSAHVGFSPFSPSNPAGPWFPNILRDRRVKVTAYWNSGASSAVRFNGWIDTWIPDAGERPPATATVTLTGSCILSRYARRGALSHYAETALVGVQKDDIAYLPFDDAPDSTAVRVLRADGIAVHPQGVVIQPNKIPGSATLGTPDSGHLTDGQVEFTRGDDGSPAPVIRLPLTGQPLTGLQAWYKLSDDPAGAAGDDVICAFDSAGDFMWAWGPRIVSGQIQWTLADNTGAQMSFYGTGGPREDGWHYWSVEFPSATASRIRTADKGETSSRLFGSFAWAYDPRQVRYLSIGGRLFPFRPGKQTNTYKGAISSLMLTYNLPVPAERLKDGNPGFPVPADNASGLMNGVTLGIDTLVGGATTGSGDSTILNWPNGTRDMLSRWSELAVSTMGRLSTDPDGKRRYLPGYSAKSIALAVTLDAEQDLSAPDGGWGGVTEELPTRVTVSSPLGSFEVVDTVTEAATGLRLDSGTLETAAGTESGARSIGNRFLTTSAERIGSFGVDLTTTSTSKITDLMALRVNQLMRITGLPASYLGFTYMDVYASGWLETYDAEDQSCRFQFDSDPADSPPAAIYDDSTYGRFGLTAATVTGGTCIGNTGTGTLIITSANGVLSTSAGSYPLDLNWNGERVTIGAAPAGGTSPQTVTVTARGVAPSVARVHATNEPVDVYMSWTWGP